MTLSELAIQKLPPRWKFWRKTERRFWLGAILADYARITGSEKADRAADRIFEETYHFLLTPSTKNHE